MNNRVSNYDGEEPQHYKDQTETSFRDNELQEVQLKNLIAQGDPSVEQRIMEIFYKSQFYQEKSNNEQLRQQQFQGNLKDQLKNMKGIQFVVSKSFPDKNLFWIEKRHRPQPNADYDVISVYYMLNFEIFQAPTLSHLVDTRINNAIFFQKKAFEMMQSASEVLYTKQSSWAENQARN